MRFRARMTNPKVTEDPGFFMLFTPLSCGCGFLAHSLRKLLGALAIPFTNLSNREKMEEANKSSHLPGLLRSLMHHSQLHLIVSELSSYGLSM